MTDLSRHSYEAIVRLLRGETLTRQERERLTAELQCRNRAMHNLEASILGGDLR